MSDERGTQALHTALLDAINAVGRRSFSGGAREAISATRSVLELHKPEFFGGFIACLACSPGMPPPLLVEWKDCETVKVIASALGVVADG